MVLLCREPYSPKHHKSIVSQLKIVKRMRVAGTVQGGGAHGSTWHTDPYPADGDIIQYTWRRPGLDRMAACTLAPHDA